MTTSVRAELPELRLDEELRGGDAAPGDAFGTDVDATSTTVVVGAPGSAAAGAVYVFVRDGAGFTQQAKLVGPDSQATDLFGVHVAIDGDTLVVGAERDETTAGTWAGSAYVFVRNGTAWSFEQKLEASDAAAFDRFGSDVSIAGDTILVGSPQDELLGNGATYVYTRTAGVWSEETKLVAPDGDDGDRFGAAVSVDGDTALVGAPEDDDEGSASVFVRSGTSWAFQDRLSLGGSLFGSALDLEGDRALVGKAGTVASFVRTGTSWSLEGQLREWDCATGFGWESLSLSGDLAFVGAWRAGDVCGCSAACESGAAYMFRFNGSVWRSLDRYASELAGSTDRLGQGGAFCGDQLLVGVPGEASPVVSGAVYALDLADRADCLLDESELDGLTSGGGRSVSVSGSTAAVSSSSFSDPGTLRVFERSGTSWSQAAAIPAPGTDSYPLTLDQDTLAVRQGTNVHVYVRTGTSWIQEDTLTSAGVVATDGFGVTLGLDSNTLVVGAAGDDDLGNAAGAAYVFVRTGTTWSEQAKLFASDAATFDQFGASVALDGDRIAVGALFADGPVNDAGAVYLFERSGTSWTEVDKLAPTDIETLDQFGCLLALDGGTLLVGSEVPAILDPCGSAYVFTRAGTAWSEAAKLVQQVDALDVDGDRLVLGNADGDGTGNAKVFARNGTSWTLEVELFAQNAQVNEDFGAALALDGNRAVVGSPARQRAYAFELPAASPSFCDAGDDALASCPCGNPGAPTSGCDIQQATGGVELGLVTQSDGALNRVTWSGTGFPPASNPTSIVIRASALDVNAPIVFGDGLRCVATPLVRLAATFASAGTAVHTHGHGTMAGSGDFFYQLWFRNSPVMYCDPTAAFNLSNGRILTW